MPTKTIGVFTLLANTPNEVITTKFTNQAVSWLFDINQSKSLTRYWREVMDGYFQLLPTVHNRHIVEVPASVVTKIILKAKGSRNPALEQIATVLEAGGISVTGFDLLAFFVGGRSVGAGTGGLYRDGRWVATSMFDEFSSLGFMQHELGHLFGLDHPFDTRQAVPTYPNGEYGDPACIMSAEHFATHKSTFAIPAAEQNTAIAASDVVWQRAGPGVSPATVWRFTPGFPNPLPWMTVLPANAQATSVRLRRPGYAQGTRLVVMPAGGNTWFTAEYRPGSLWDRSFTPNADATETFSGLVIHEIRDVGATSDGEEWPKIQRVCYETTIPTPSTGDLDWSNGRFAVRVIRAGGNWADIEVGASLPVVPDISLGFDCNQEFETSSPGPEVEVSRVGSRCETGVYTSNRSLYRATLRATATTLGFNSPFFRFELNNTPLGSWQAPSAKFSGTANVVLSGDVPTSTAAKSPATLTIRVTYEGEGNSITVHVPSGDGEYELSLVAYATDSPPADSIGIASTAGHAAVKTLRFTLPSEAIEDMGACLRSIADGIRVKKQWPPNRDEHPNFRHFAINEIWVPNHLPQLGAAIIAAVELETVNPAVGTRLIDEAASKLGMLSSEVRDLAAEVRRKVDAPR